MLPQIWNKLVSTGLSEEIEDQEFIKIRVLNQISLVAMLICIFLFIFVLLFQQDVPRALKNLISVSFSIAILTLHHHKFYNLPRHITCFLFPFWIAISMLSTPTYSIGESAIFLVTVLIAFMLYEGQLKHKIACLIWNIALLTGALTYIASFSSIYLNPFGVIVLTIGLVIILSFIFTFYQNNINTVVQQKNNLLKQLQLKNAELERFAYITSHDLKEPVKNIEGFSSVLRKSLGKEAESEQLQLTNMIYTSAKRMSTLIDSILKFSKLEKDEVKFESVDLNDIVQQFKNSHHHFLQESKAVIQHDTLPSIQGNKVYLSLLFQNLIENGIRYNESEIPSVKIFAHQEKDKIHLVLDDNGIGIKKEYATYVFEPFRRLHNRSKYKGTGLGLAICKKIVENHSGKIWVESRANGGSQFNILLPTNKKSMLN